ncbi:MAG: manganese efflux pump MntP family protein [Candidatus Cloacimonetes bacterium]|nr:manganese efflux pump MntP family protein [Candidatus Cloacimonadota bacterium]
MHFATILLISLGLAMDAFAVSVSSGVVLTCFRKRYALKIALFFGVFQAVMPLIGWSAGLTFRNYISAVDHWIAFALLSIIGGKMIYESLITCEKEKSCNPENIMVLLMLAVATSIDALAVGISFSCLEVSIITPALIIGIVTFVLSFAGVFIGNKFGSIFENKMELIGGLILIGIGIKILVEHLFWGMK